MIRDLDALIGARLVVGIPGTIATDEVIEHLKHIRAGGLIPFARNLQSPEQFRRLLSQLHDALGRQVLVMVDHEGGRVVRFSSGVTQFPDALTVGTTKEPGEVRQQGEIEAKELKALGVAVNLAPCVDVLVEGADPVIGTRSYGRDPQRVASLGAARIQGMQRQGLAACAKHFPGIGAVPKDPHTSLPTVQLDWSAMRHVHLVPFVEAIRVGVATLMSSHVCYPKLEPSSHTPATFSVRLMRDLLRGELGFDGVVLSDDLEMGALREVCSVGEAAVRAVEAGHDALLVCSDLAAQREVFEALRVAYYDGRLPVEELERSVERIRRLAEKFSHTKSP